MSKKKRKHPKRRNPVNPVYEIQMMPLDENYTNIPYSLLDAKADAKISDAAFCVALYLYYYRESISQQYPGVKLLALSQEMPLDVVQGCEKELITAGILMLREYGFFDLKDAVEVAPDSE